MIFLTLATALHWMDHMPPWALFTYNRPIQSSRTNSHRGPGQRQSAWGQLMFCAPQRKQKGGSGVKLKVLHLCMSHDVSREEIRRHRDEVEHGMILIMLEMNIVQWRCWNHDNNSLNFQTRGSNQRKWSKKWKTPGGVFVWPFWGLESQTQTTHWTNYMELTFQIGQFP